MRPISQNPELNPGNSQRHENNPHPPSFFTLNWAARIKVGAAFVLSGACFTAGGIIMAGTIALGTPIAVSFFLAGITLFFHARHMLNQAAIEQQVEDNVYVTSVIAEEIVAIKIRLTEISTDLEALLKQNEDIDGQHVIMGLKIRETQDRLKTQLHYLGQLARTKANHSK